MPLMKSFLSLNHLLWACLAYPLAYIFLGCLCVLRLGLPRCSGLMVGRLVWAPILTSVLILEMSCRAWPGLLSLSVHITQHRLG